MKDEKVADNLRIMKQSIDVALGNKGGARIILDFYTHQNKNPFGY